MPPTLLYSTNTWLAYTISQTYYHAEHYVWCSPYPNSRWLPTGLASLPPSSSPGDIYLSLPPSSSPGDIYLSLHADILGGDLHSAKVDQNRDGIRNGARIKHAAGIITEAQLEDIEKIVNRSSLRDFRPLLYVIPFGPVADRVEAVPLARRASLFHEEYIIERLPRALFEVIELLEV